VSPEDAVAGVGPVLHPNHQGRPFGRSYLMSSQVDTFIQYPIYPTLTRLERALLRLKLNWPAKCPVCGSLTLITDVGRSLRESCKCMRCGSTNRQRQVAYVVCGFLSRMTGAALGSLKDVARLDNTVIFNTEAGRQIHDQLAGMRGYLCSEYFGDGFRSGDMVDGKMHQDLMGLSFDDGSIDLVISSDVFEHIRDPYLAHKEIHRVLKPGGAHVFTVPFYQTEFVDEERTVTDIRGNTVFVKEPMYHGDPLRPDGSLVHKIFSLEMLVKLGKIGFRTNMYKIYKPSLGILGPNALVFEAVKA
jgi:SAM-dependent methyltransferase